MTNPTHEPLDEISNIPQSPQYYQKFSIPSQQELDFVELEDTRHRINQKRVNSRNIDEIYKDKLNNVDMRLDNRYETIRTTQMQEMQLQLSNLQMQYNQQQKLLQQLLDNSDTQLNSNYKNMVRNQFLTLDQQVKAASDVTSAMQLKYARQFGAQQQQISEMQKDILKIMELTVRAQSEQKRHKSTLVKQNAKHEARYRMLYRIIRKSKIYDLYLLQKLRKTGSAALRGSSAKQPGKSAQFDNSVQMRSKTLDLTQQQLQTTTQQQQLMQNLFGNNTDDAAIQQFKQFMRSTNLQIHYINRAIAKNSDDLNEKLNGQSAQLRQIVENGSAASDRQILEVQRQLDQLGGLLGDHKAEQRAKLSELAQSAAEQAIATDGSFNAINSALAAQIKQSQLQYDELNEGAQKQRNANNQFQDQFLLVEKQISRIDQEIMDQANNLAELQKLQQNHYDEYLVFTRHVNNFEVLSKLEDLENGIEKVKTGLQENEEKVFDYVRLFQQMNQTLSDVKERVQFNDSAIDRFVMQTKADTELLHKDIDDIKEQFNIQLISQLISNFTKQHDLKFEHVNNTLQKYEETIAQVRNARNDYSELEARIDQFVQVQKDEIIALMQDCVNKVDQTTLQSQFSAYQKQLNAIKDKVKLQTKKYCTQLDEVEAKYLELEEKTAKQLSNNEKLIAKISQTSNAKLELITEKCDVIPQFEQQIQEFSHQISDINVQSTNSIRQQKIIENEVNNKLQLFDEQLQILGDEVQLKFEVQYNNFAVIEKEFKQQLAKYRSNNKISDDFQSQLIIIKDQLKLLQNTLNNSSFSTQNMHQQSQIEKFNKTIIELVEHKGLTQNTFQQLQKQFNQLNVQIEELTLQLNSQKNEQMNILNSVLNAESRLNQQKQINQYFCSRFDLIDAVEGVAFKSETATKCLNASKLQNQIEAAETMRLLNTEDIINRQKENKINVDLSDNSSNVVQKQNQPQQALKQELRQEDIEQQLQKQNDQTSFLRDMLQKVENSLK